VVEVPFGYPETLGIVSRERVRVLKADATGGTP
jgi:hypothetical protein